LDEPVLQSDLLDEVELGFAIDFFLSMIIFVLIERFVLRCKDRQLKIISQTIFL